MALTTRLELSRQALSGLQDKKGHRVPGIVGAIDFLKSQHSSGADQQQIEENFALALRVADLEALQLSLLEKENNELRQLYGELVALHDRRYSYTCFTSTEVQILTQTTAESGSKPRQVLRPPRPARMRACSLSCRSACGCRKLAGTQFTCFTSTNVQIPTQEADSSRIVHDLQERLQAAQQQQHNSCPKVQILT